MSTQADDERRARVKAQRAAQGLPPKIQSRSFYRSVAVLLGRTRADHGSDHATIRTDRHEPT